MPKAGKDLVAVLRALKVSASKLDRQGSGHCRKAAVIRGRKCEKVRRLNHFKDENRRASLVFTRA